MSIQQQPFDGAIGVPCEPNGRQRTPSPNYSSGPLATYPAGILQLCRTRLQAEWVWILFQGYSLGMPHGEARRNDLPPST